MIAEVLRHDLLANASHRSVWKPSGTTGINANMGQKQDECYLSGIKCTTFLSMLEGMLLPFNLYTFHFFGCRSNHSLPFSTFEHSTMKGANISIINLHLKMAFSPHLIGWDEINFHIQSPNFGSFSTRSVKLCCGSSFVALLCQGLGIPYMLGLPKPCNFTVGKNNRSLFHVLRDLYSPSAKSSVYHQCLGINTQHRLFAKIFWKAREFSCSISELWMSSVRVHWECLFPFLFCFWKMWCLFFFFSIFLIGVLRLISQCLLLFQNDQNIWKTPPLPPGLGSPKTSAFQRTKKAWCNSWFNQEWLGTSTSVPERRNRYQLGKLIFRNPVVSTVFGGGLVGAKSPCVYSVSKDIPGGQQDLFFSQQQYHWYHWY